MSAVCLTHYEMLENHIAKLEDELDEIKRSYKEIVDSPCGTDMLHCACVPALRDEIVTLRAEVEETKILIEKADEDTKNLLGVIQKFKSDLSTAVEVLRKIAAPISCGCKPCTGDRTSESAAKIILEEIQSESRAFLARMEVKP